MLSVPFCHFERHRLSVWFPSFANCVSTLLNNYPYFSSKLHIWHSLNIKKHTPFTFLSYLNHQLNILCNFQMKHLTRNGGSISRIQILHPWSKLYLFQIMQLVLFAITSILHIQFCKGIQYNVIIISTQTRWIINLNNN